MKFPDNVKDYDFKNLMQRMLEFNWDDLISLNMEPAYIPRIPNIDHKFTPKPYVDFIKTVKDWEPPDKMPEPDRLKRIEFNEWLKKF